MPSPPHLLRFPKAMGWDDSDDERDTYLLSIKHRQNTAGMLVHFIYSLAPAACSDSFRARPVERSDFGSRWDDADVDKKMEEPLLCH